jgi:hypothetical protein
VSSPPLPNRSVGARDLFSNLLHGRVASPGTTRSGGAGPAAAVVGWLSGELPCSVVGSADTRARPPGELFRREARAAGELLLATASPRATPAPPQLWPPWTRAALPTAGCQIGRGGGRRWRRPHPPPHLLPAGDHCSATRMV